MHEFGIGEAVVGAVLARAGDRPVARVAVRVGVLQRVDVAALRQAFELAAAGTAAAGAEVDVDPVAVRATCRDCSSDVASDDALPACPACGGVNLDVVEGDELTVVSLTYAQPATAAEGA